MNINIMFPLIIFFIFSISSSADEIDYYEEANLHLKQQEFQSSYEIYKDLANNGDVKSMLKLGEMYEFGMGMDINISVAHSWYKKAAKLGYRPAVDKLESLEDLKKSDLDDRAIQPTERQSNQEKPSTSSVIAPIIKNDWNQNQTKTASKSSPSPDEHWIYWLFMAVIAYYFFKFIVLPILRFFASMLGGIESYLYDRNQYRIAKKLTNENLNELLIHRRIGTIQGHFNKTDDSGWTKKKIFFIKKIITEKSGGEINHSNYIKISKLIDKLTKDYDESKLLDSENLTGHQYEQYVANKLNDLGWKTIITPGSGDNGVDIVATKQEVNVAIQCKKHSKNVSNKAVQEIYSGKDIYKAQIAAVITNNTYTKSAKNAAANLKVYLLNDHHLNELDDIVNNYIQSKQ
jgi:HJR/Mrr/RecB family endonuclease